MARRKQPEKEGFALADTGKEGMVAGVRQLSHHVHRGVEERGGFWGSTLTSLSVLLNVRVVYTCAYVSV